MSDSDSVARLRLLGLNLYESRAYLALLDAKQMTAKDLGELALIPRSRTYDVLDSLTKKGFAFATPASPPAFAPVSPLKALTSFYETERKKIRERVTGANEEAQAKLEAIRDAYLGLANDFPPEVTMERVDRDRVWVLQTRESIENTLIEFIKDAKSDVLRITKPPTLKRKEPFDPFYIVGIDNQRFLYDALKRKVKMRWLSLSREIPSYIGLEVHEPPERRYLDRDQDITEKFLLIDGHSVLLNLHDPVSSAYGSIALAIQSNSVSSIFLDHFEKLWDRGKPLAEIQDRARTQVAELSSELKDAGFSRADVALYRMLAKSGGATRESILEDMLKRRFEQRTAMDSLERLIRLSVLHKDVTHGLIMVEHPADVRSSISAGELRGDSEGVITTRKPASSGNL